MHVAWAMPPEVPGDSSATNNVAHTGTFDDSTIDLSPGDFDTAVPPARAAQGRDSPEAADESGFWQAAAGRMQHESLRDAGLLDGRELDRAEPMSSARDTGRHGAQPGRVVSLATYVVAPFYLPECFEVSVQVPCEEDDVSRAVARSMTAIASPSPWTIATVRPQPSSDFASFAVFPEWTTFAGLSAVVLDLRLATIDGKGPIIGAYLTRPTSVAEIRREAGVFSIGSVRILVGSALVSLEEEDIIQVQNGCLIRLVRHEYAIEPVRSLAQALQHEPFEGLVGPFPRVPTVRPLMLLHRSGKFIFSGARPGGAPLHTAIINFVGVPAGSVSFHSPGDGDLERLFYRGTNVRSVLALADLQPGAEEDFVLFLDLRPMAASAICVSCSALGRPPRLG